MKKRIHFDHKAERHKTPGGRLRVHARPSGVGILKHRHHRLEIIPIGLLTENIHDRPTVKALSLAFAVKAMYRSSWLKDATYARIAQMFGISRAKAKEYIAILSGLNLIERKGKDILFKGFRHAGKYKFVSIQDYSKINITDLRETEKYLRLQAVKIKQSQIDYAANNIKALGEPESTREYKMAKRYQRFSGWGREVDEGQSVKTVGKTSGLSKGMAVKLLMWGEAKKLLKKEKRVVRVAHYPSQEELAKHSFHCSYFYYQGCCYRAMTSLLKFI